MANIGNSITQQGFTPAVDLFSGNGSTTSFTLSRPVASVAQVEAVIENVVQSPYDAYTVNGNTITFTSAPPSGSNNIYVRYTSLITQVIAPSDGSVGTNQLATGAVTAMKMAAGAAVSNIGAGGITPNELAISAQSAGYGQTWQNVKASRSAGTTYTNTTGKPIAISISVFPNGISASSSSLSINGISIGAVGINTGGYNLGYYGTLSGIIPSGATYSFTLGNATSLDYWVELR
jgi:hypothetical protein